MELKDIYELWDRFEKSSTTQLELDFQGMHLKLNREIPGNGNTAASVVSVTDGAQPSQKTMPETQQESVRYVKAPLVGMFYASPAPGEPPFVSQGQKVSKGDVLGIIEAMKCMNEIVAAEDGVIDQILVSDAELVEYDQPLMTFH